MIAPQVVNEGVISAKLGKVQLASGTSATLDLSGDGLLNVALDEKAAGIIKNTGTTTIMVTHDEREAERLSDECFLLENGKIRKI